MAVLITDLVGSASLRTRARRPPRRRDRALARRHPQQSGRRLPGDDRQAARRRRDGRLHDRHRRGRRRRGDPDPHRAREPRRKLASHATCASASARAKSSWKRTTCADCRRPKRRACVRVPKVDRSSPRSSSSTWPRPAARHTFRPVGVVRPEGLARTDAARTRCRGRSAATTPFRSPTRSIGRARVRVRRARTRELAVLRRVWKRRVRRRARSSSVLVTGEAGAGKSRLISRVRPFDRSPTAHTSCTAAATKSPDIRSSRSPSGCATTSRTRRRPSVGMVRARGTAASCRGSCPSSSSAHSASDHAQLGADHGDPFPLYEAVLGWLTLVADGGPVLLVLDDLQWASRPTLAVLQHLLARRAEVSRRCCSRRAATTTFPSTDLAGAARTLRRDRTRCSGSRSAVSSRTTSSRWSPSRRALARRSSPIRSSPGDPRGVGRQSAVRHVARRAARVRRPARGCGGRTNPYARPSA